MKLPILLRTSLVLAACLLPAGLPALAQDAKQQAIERLAASHDPEIPVAIGRVVAKQAGLNAIRTMLAARGRKLGLGPDWTSAALEWQQAERALAKSVDDLIATRLEDPSWFREGLGVVAATVLNAEEADEITEHFSTEGGREQRIVVELALMGETVLANYTFTGRLDHRVAGSERELEQLQKTWWAREPFRVRDFSRYPDAVRFAGENPGIKYTKMLAIQGIEVVTRRIDLVAAETAQVVETADIQPYVDAFRSRKAVSK